MTINLTVNDKDVQLNVDPDTPLLFALRNDLQLNGPKFGCGVAQCGACAVLVDGNALRSCVIPVAGVVGRKIVTLEGLGSHANTIEECLLRPGRLLAIFRPPWKPTVFISGVPS